MYVEFVMFNLWEHQHSSGQKDIANYVIYFREIFSLDF